MGGGTRYRAQVGATAASVIGQSDAARSNLAAIVDGIVRADATRAGNDPQDSALATLLRVIDTARYTVDSSAKASDQHLQALLGDPVLILRARLRLSIDDPQRDPARRVNVPVRLGAIDDLHDGLLCYYLTDQPGRLRLVHAALAQAPALPLRAAAVDGGATDAIDDGMADTSGIVWIDADSDLDLLLLVAPGADVGVTSGLAPGKVLEMQREWFDKPISRLTPTLRFDAVLRDPAAPRMPAATDLHGDWEWIHRVAPAQWKQEKVAPPTAGQLDPLRPAVVEDGYLRSS